MEVQKRNLLEMDLFVGLRYRKRFSYFYVDILVTLVACGVSNLVMFDA